MNTWSSPLAIQILEKVKFNLYLHLILCTSRAFNKLGRAHLFLNFQVFYASKQAKQLSE